MPYPTLRFVAPLVISGMFCSLPLYSQAPAQTPGTTDQPGYKLNLSTRIVVLDVVVTDKHGNLVHKTNLTKDDFTIYESKVPQTIRSFEAPPEHAMPVSATAIVNSAADLPKIGQAPVTVLVLDELNSQFTDMSFARQMMVKYLTEQPAVLKQPTVLLAATNTKFVPLHDYTQNRDELIELVKKHMPEIPWRMSNGGNGGPGGVERMAQVLAALQQLAQATSGTPGRKNVIWVGNGFPTADLIGMEQHQADVIQNAVRAVTAKLLASRITMYTINPIAGSSATLDIETPDDMHLAGNEAGPVPFGEGTVNFSSLAPSTGGMSFQGRNDLNNVIGEGIAHGDEYYTMSYVPTDKTDDPAKFRNIVIVMKDPALRATTRAGYFPESASDINPLMDKTLTDKQKGRDIQLDISQALTSTITYNGLNVTATKGKDGVYTVHVAELGLAWSDASADGSQHSEATVAAAWYDAKGKIVSHVAAEETSPRGETGAGATYKVTPNNVPANAVKMRIVIRDAFSGKMGTFDGK